MQRGLVNLVKMKISCRQTDLKITLDYIISMGYNLGKIFFKNEGSDLFWKVESVHQRGYDQVYLRSPSERTW